MEGLRTCDDEPEWVELGTYHEIPACYREWPTHPLNARRHEINVSHSTIFLSDEEAVNLARLISVHCPD